MDTGLKTVLYNSRDQLSLPVGLLSFSHLRWFSEKQSYLPSSAESSSDPAPLLVVSVKISQDPRKNNHTLDTDIKPPPRYLHSHDSVPMWEFKTFL